MNFHCEVCKDAVHTFYWSDPEHGVYYCKNWISQSRCFWEKVDKTVNNELAMKRIEGV